MPDTIQQPELEGAQTPAEPTEAPPKKRGKKERRTEKRTEKRSKPRRDASVVKRSIWEDKTVRILGFGAAGLVLLYLVVIIAAMLMGFIANEQPTTMVDRNLRIYKAEVESGSTEEEHWAGYADTLISAGSLNEAQNIIDRAKEIGIENNQNRGLFAAQARLYYETERYEEAIETADEGLDLLREQATKDFEAAVSGAGPTKLSAAQWPQGLWTMMLVRAQSYEKLGDDEGAVEALSEYIAMQRFGASILR